MQSVWKRFVKWRRRHLPTALARDTMRRVALSWTQTDSAGWSAYSNVSRYGYPVTMHLLVRERFVMCMATAELVMDRDLIQRDMPLLLLVENNHIGYGSFRLSERPENMVELVHGHWVDAELFSATIMANIVRTLIDQMQIMITVLYARELIVAGRRKETHVDCRQNAK